MRYFFYILDVNKTGLVEKVSHCKLHSQLILTRVQNEVKHFVQMIWNHEYNTNVSAALEHLEATDDGDGTFNFKEIWELQEKYPNTFFPVFNLQIHIIQHTLGDWFWDCHKAMIRDTKEDAMLAELAELKKRQKADADKEEQINDEVVIKRMGYFRFHLMPWLRKRERERILKIAAIEAELEEFKGKGSNRRTVSEEDDKGEDENDE